VFRAGASAWDTGYAKAHGGSIVRTINGAIQRELSKAVDGRFFGGDYGNAWNYNVPVRVTPTEVEFIYYRDNLSRISSAFEPAPLRVRYRISGGRLLRNEAVLKKSGNGLWGSAGFGPDNIILRFSDEVADSTSGQTFVSFQANTSDNVRKIKEDEDSERWDIVSVTIRVEIYRSMKMSTITVRSYGPDGQSGNPKTERDDIILQW